MVHALDAAKSRIRIRTYAEGIFARLAHDLELVCEGVTGSVTDDRAEVVVPIASIAVAGVLRGESVDPQGLSDGDKKDCLAKMRREVFGDAVRDVVRVEARLDGRSAHVKVLLPSGKSFERSVPVEVDGRRVKGELEISLFKIGAPVVKGPMNAFRVKDAVRVLFDVSFA